MDDPQHRPPEAPEPDSPQARRPAPAGPLLSPDDFRVVRKLGVGAMGKVYLARQLSQNRDVALKILSRHLTRNRTFLKRFLREARVMARLDHPNIVRCYGLGTTKGRPFFAMEYADGGSLRQWLVRLGRFEVGDALYVLAACARALQHAHERGLVHRDVKPDNVLLTRFGVVKLADLGLAKALREDVSVTQTGHGAGTPVYMAPEQARNAKYVDRRSDIYALGCVLYDMLTGQLPFRGESALEVILAKFDGQFVPARRLNPAVPVPLERVLGRMLAPQPAWRYQNCGELLADLEPLGVPRSGLRFLRDDPPPASGPPTPPPAEFATRVEAPPDGWHVVHQAPDGRWVTRRLETGQVRTLLENGDLGPEAQASRTFKGDYRPLFCYPEFEDLTRRLADNDDEADAGQGTPRRLFWVAAVGVACFLGFLGVHALLTWAAR